MRARSTARVLARYLTLVAALCLASASLAAPERRLALDADATVYRLQQGAYGELFPAGTAAAPDNPVLALDVRSAGGAVQRWLVPGTETWDPESSSSLVYEKSTGVVYLLWQTLFNGIHPLLHLTSFDGAEWTSVVEIANGPFTRKGSPRLAVTREAGPDGADRTLLHLVWWEAVPGESSRKRYAPIFVDGVGDVGAPPVFDLSSFLPARDDSPRGDAAGLENALALRPGANDHSVVVGFLDPNSHRLVTLRVELLPRELDNLADEIRAHIVIVGDNSITTPADLADSAHSKLLEIGTDFHEATRHYLAEQVRKTVMSTSEHLSPEEITSIADVIRAHIVIVGSRIRVGGIEDVSDSEILEIGPTPNGSYQHLNVSVISSREAPEVGGPAKLLLSESGRSAIVTWEEDGCVHYRESSGDGWSDPGVIELTEDLDRESVYRLLEERVRAD